MRMDWLKSALLIVVLCSGFSACADNGASEPTPEAAKRFLKLRGYEFDEPSFFKAAEAGDAIAVNGFLSAGINANAKDDNGDTALTAAAARGDAQIVGVLLKRGADVNARGRNNWTALLLALKEERPGSCGCPAFSIKRRFKGRDARGNDGTDACRLASTA